METARVASLFQPPLNFRADILCRASKTVTVNRDREGIQPPTPKSPLSGDFYGSRFTVFPPHLLSKLTSIPRQWSAQRPPKVHHIVNGLWHGTPTWHCRRVQRPTREKDAACSHKVYRVKRRLPWHKYEVRRSLRKQSAALSMRLLEQPAAILASVPIEHGHTIMPLLTEALAGRGRQTVRRNTAQTPLRFAQPLRTQDIEGKHWPRQRPTP